MALTFRNIFKKKASCEVQSQRRSHSFHGTAESGSFGKKGMHAVCMQGTWSATKFCTTALRVPMRCRVHRTQNFPQEGENKSLRILNSCTQFKFATQVSENSAFNLLRNIACVHAIVFSLLQEFVFFRLAIAQSNCFNFCCRWSIEVQELCVE